MHNLLIYSDIHISQSSLKECILILEEIGMLANKYDCDTLINLGDSFDNLKPSSQELDVFATFINRLRNKKHIILAADSHESTTQEESILNHYGILSDNVQIVKELKINNHLYCGHYTLKESKSGYGAKLSKEDLKNYLYVFLGHQHSYQIIKPNICHLGSCRWVDFAEASDKHKIIAIISDYNTDKENVHFIGLKSPIPMIQLELGQKSNQITSKIAQNSPVEPLSSEQGKDTINQNKSISEGENPSNNRIFNDVCQLISYLNSISDKTKVKIVIKDFENYRNLLPKIGFYQSKFATFKVSTDFEVVSVCSEKDTQSEMTTFRESFKDYLENNKIDDKVKEILQKEIE